jgi:multidrug efflux system outer membrane protein
MSCKSIFMCGAALFLVGCATTRAPYSPPTDVETKQVAFQIAANIDPLADDPAHDWWKALGDPALISLIEYGLSENNDLQAAKARIQIARAARALQQTTRRPTGSLSGSVDLSQPALGGGPIQVDVDPQTVLSLGGTAIWEIDLFGRLEALDQAAEADLVAREWDRRGVQTLIAAEIARAWLDLRAAESGLALTDDNLRIQEGLLDLTEIRLEEGFATRLDRALASSQVNTTRALVPPLKAERNAALNRLATLTAQPISAVEAIVGKGGLPEQLPDTLPLGDIEGLLKRRPDIRAAERTVASAFARADAVYADFFPRLELVGSTTLVGTSIDRLTGSNAFGFGIGPQLVWDGLDRERVQARLDGATAETDAAQAIYEGRVLTALEETQTQFSNFASQIESLAELAEASEEARTAVELSRIRYEEGEDDFLIVLDAEGRLLDIVRSRLEARRASLAAAINVYQALGAGWRDE